MEMAISFKIFHYLKIFWLILADIGRYLVSATNRNNCEILMQRHSGIVNETKAFIKKCYWEDILGCY